MLGIAVCVGRMLPRPQDRVVLQQASSTYNASRADQEMAREPKTENWSEVWV